MSGLKDSLLYIGTKYDRLKRERAMRDYITHNFKESLENSIRINTHNYKYKTKYGDGNWSRVPWGAVLDSRVTTTSQKGYYVVYLFSDIEPVVYLSLNQGVIDFRKDFGYGKKCCMALEESADYLRNKIPQHHDRFNLFDIALSTNPLPKQYASAHIVGVRYELNDLPEENVLCRDLNDLLVTYLDLFNTLKIQEDDERDSKRSYANRPPVRDNGDTGENRDKELIVDSKGKPGLKRNGKYKDIAIQNSNFSCELGSKENQHNTFIWGNTKHNYVEGHHLIPMNAYAAFDQHIDCVSNIVALCPNCHRCVHHGSDSERKELLLKLYNDRIVNLNKANIFLEFPQLLEFYGIENE